MDNKWFYPLGLNLGSWLCPNCTFLPVTFLLWLSLAPPYTEWGRG